jgi:16S rRNA (adenine1518-N6/adenine1519-N6)-dimethyltransferase
MYVKAKKSLGQHFLKDQNIARKIVNSLTLEGYSKILEIGPGMGVLTRFLAEKNTENVYAVDIDKESIDYLIENIPELKDHIIFGDFLKMDLDSLFTEPFAVIGNFPYNISSQIFFRVLENRDRIPEVVGMIQKEVAERIAAPHGNKVYGIMSVLLQAFFDIDYLFTVPEHVFAPPPKVKSAVIRLKRNATTRLDCDEELFFKIVKATFNQRRKTIHNSLKALNITGTDCEYLTKRPEQLSVNEFIKLTQWAEKNKQHRQNDLT